MKMVSFLLRNALWEWFYLREPWEILLLENVHYLVIFFCSNRTFQILQRFLEWIQEINWKFNKPIYSLSKTHHHCFTIHSKNYYNFIYFKYTLISMDWEWTFILWALHIWNDPWHMVLHSTPMWLTCPFNQYRLFIA